MFFGKKKKKVLVIGLDCADPKLLFEEFKDKLPNLKMMMEAGFYSSLRTIHPPITIPAWMAMCTGKDAGQLGVYGFRTRKNNSYTDFDISTSSVFLNTKKIWDVLSEKGKRSIVVSVPPSYPVYPINGEMISCFICPDSTKDYTYPASLKAEIEKVIGSYTFDVIFRTEDRDKILEQAHKMTNDRFDVIEYLLKRKNWDFFMSVEIGLDRLQHAFWKYYDSTHHLYEPNHKYKDVISDYYKLLDERIGRLVSIVDDNTTVLVVSDHGSKSMRGAFCINEWLIKKGYLVLNKYPERIERFEKLDVDWSKTRVWGWGGYYSRVFINKKERESEGIVEEKDYESLRDELKKTLESEKDKIGNPWKTKVYRPEELYSSPQGELPDLMVYLDDLSYRSAGTVGHKKLYLDENDTGPDDAVHNWKGVFIFWNKNKDIVQKATANLSNVSVLDIYRIVLENLGIQK